MSLFALFPPIIFTLQIINIIELNGALNNRYPQFSRASTEVEKVRRGRPNRALIGARFLRKGGYVTRARTRGYITGQIQ